jgi:transcription-repair coupling factor (superfamily II helicase)
MFLYFVGEDNKAYYRSPAFGRVLTYMQQNPRTTRLRDKSGVRSMVIESVTTVESALSILRLIATLPAA